MTPIEAMAKEKWLAAGVRLGDHLGNEWESLDPDLRRGQIEDMRAALLALADCEIPADIPARAWSMHEENIPEGVVIDVNAMMVAEFRAMLRSIATGG